jgi:two-component system sensor histidine kinase KdpD
MTQLDPARARHSTAPASRRSGLVGYASAVGVVCIATGIGWMLSYGLRIPDIAERPRFANTNVLMLYLLGVLWVATRYTRGPAVLASILGVAAFDVCFVPPYFTFTVNDEQYLATFVVMLLTALTISTLTHRARVQSEAAREAWERVETEFLRNTLLSGVSHELRTPLAAITGAASTLIEAREQLSPDSRGEMLSTIYDESERMERLINNLLEMSRLESGSLVLKQDWVPLAELIGSALRRLDRSLNGREVKIDLPRDLPLLYVDGLGIEQVLVNLIDNAIQYAPGDSPIEITARAAGAGGDVSVEVADHGPGLPKGAESRVFEKFFRSHGSRPERGRGIGLGLAICRAIVEAHGGSITAANRPGDGPTADGGGSVFRFTIPQRRVPPVVDASG